MSLLLTASIMKVGAHIDDTRALVHAWDPTVDDGVNVERIVDSNLLGLPSRSRAHDVMTRALRPRFIAPEAGIIDALGVLSTNAEAFRDACYYEMARVDGLVAAFMTEQVQEWWDDGRVAIDSGDARRWIDKLGADGRVPEWSPNIRERVARSLLAALRDVGRLVGVQSSPRKEIARPGITTGGFAYTAFRLHQQGASSRALISSPSWKLWLLDASRVEEQMQRLASLGIVYYSAAGSTRRIDWRAETLAEVARGAV